MKNYIKYSILFLFPIIVSCNQNKTTEKNDNSPKEIIKTNLNFKTTTNHLSEYNELVPLTILDSVNDNVYEAYGIDFQGNCYDCDLTEIHISKKSFNFVNVCNQNTILQFENYTYTEEKDQLIIKTAAQEFVWTKINNCPVYELKITGDALSLKNNRISKFYTHKKYINRFKEHDCGDFEG